eukprot:GEMP01059902.1.p1 GENE.GEMP01059902.1~~GEMP01059902.1.p1  ORF type:complete len:178 (+),score=50.91 GEMP01059902.1:105-638(+)
MERKNDNDSAGNNWLPDTGANSAVLRDTATRENGTPHAVDSTDKDDHYPQIYGNGWDANVDAFLGTATSRDAPMTGEQQRQPSAAAPENAKLPTRAMIIPAVLFIVFFISFIVFASSRGSFAGIVMFMSVIAMGIYSYRLIAYSQNTVDVKSALLMGHGWVPPLASTSQPCEAQDSV